VHHPGVNEPVLLFAPGAGAPSTSPWMQRFAKRLAALGRVVPFDYPYKLEGRKAPDRQPRLIEAHRAALAKAIERPHGPIVLAGKSMGSRIGCHVSLDEPGVQALVCFGYPLRGGSGALRDEVLLALRAPILFVQGSKDSLCPIDLLQGVRTKMHAESELYVVDGGNHSLELSQKALRAQGTTAEDVEQRIIDRVRSFLERAGILAGAARTK
jgi:predicted alpha/beta-hydrolase family hydrolase